MTPAGTRRSRSGSAHRATAMSFAAAVLAVGCAHCLPDAATGAPSPNEARDVLELGQCRSMTLRSERPWNSSGFFGKAGQAFRVSHIRIDVAWVDSWVESSPTEGWLGAWGPVGRFLSIGARTKMAPMYAVACTFSEDAGTAESIKVNSVVTTKGEDRLLRCFANDWEGRYSNNCGRLTIEFCRVR